MYALSYLCCSLLILESLLSTPCDLDGGSFVFEAGGRRWAMDMGSDSYQLPNYFTQDVKNNTRYNLYRKATVGHNTLLSC